MSFNESLKLMQQFKINTEFERFTSDEVDEMIKREESFVQHPKDKLLNGTLANRSVENDDYEADDYDYSNLKDNEFDENVVISVVPVYNNKTNMQLDNNRDDLNNWAVNEGYDAIRFKGNGTRLAQMPVGSLGAHYEDNMNKNFPTYLNHVYFDKTVFKNIVQELQMYPQKGNYPLTQQNNMDSEDTNTRMYGHSGVDNSKPLPKTLNRSKLSHNNKAIINNNGAKLDNYKKNHEKNLTPLNNDDSGNSTIDKHTPDTYNDLENNKLLASKMTTNEEKTHNITQGASTSNIFNKSADIMGAYMVNNEVDNILNITPSISVLP
jgi:hypothetical protein